MYTKRLQKNKQNGEILKKKWRHEVKWRHDLKLISLMKIKKILPAFSGSRDSTDV